MRRCRSKASISTVPPYSPDLNPIEEFFSELKAFIRRNWVRYEKTQNKGFRLFSNGVSKSLDHESEALWAILGMLVLVSKIING